MVRAHGGSRPLVPWACWTKVSSTTTTMEDDVPDCGRLPRDLAVNDADAGADPGPGLATIDLQWSPYMWRPLVVETYEGRQALVPTGKLVPLHSLPHVWDPASACAPDTYCPRPIEAVFRADDSSREFRTEQARWLSVLASFVATAPVDAIRDAVRDRDRGVSLVKAVQDACSGVGTGVLSKVMGLWEILTKAVVGVSGVVVLVATPDARPDVFMWLLASMVGTSNMTVVRSAEEVVREKTLSDRARRSRCLLVPLANLSASGTDVRVLEDLATRDPDLPLLIAVGCTERPPPVAATTLLVELNVPQDCSAPHPGSCAPDVFASAGLLAVIDFLCEFSKVWRL